MLAKAKLQSIVLSARIVEAEAFYRDTLGLKLRGRSDGTLVFEVGGGDLRVGQVTSVEPSEHTVLGFSVPDLDEVIAALSARGVAIEQFDKFEHEPSGALQTPDGARVAWIRDPDRNLLSVVQPPSADY
jgi:catechol 2,3-dioxygenase-like lactoylglutathione lyase family enzyme